jgi:hypothetical protein
MTDVTRPPTKFRATMLSITEVASVPQDLRPFVEFRANMEGRTAHPQDMVAVFNVLTTSSHFVVFLDPGKTIDQVETEIAPYEVLIPAETWRRLDEFLRSRAQKADGGP